MTAAPAGAAVGLRPPLRGPQRIKGVHGSRDRGRRIRNRRYESTPKWRLPAHPPLLRSDGPEQSELPPRARDALPPPLRVPPAQRPFAYQIVYLSRAAPSPAYPLGRLARRAPGAPPAVSLEGRRGVPDPSPARPEALGVVSDAAAPRDARARAVVPDRRRGGHGGRDRRAAPRERPANLRLTFAGPAVSS